MTVVGVGPTVPVLRLAGVYRIPALPLGGAGCTRGPGRLYSLCMNSYDFSRLLLCTHVAPSTSSRYSKRTGRAEKCLQEEECPSKRFAALPVSFRKGGGQIRNSLSGKVVNFYEHEGVYFIKLKIKNPNDLDENLGLNAMLDFHRQG